MIMGARVTQLIYVAAKLGIADQLKDGSKSSEELAESVGAHPRALFRVLRALASLGIFAENAENRFELTPLGALLQSEVPGSLRAYAIMNGETWWWRAYGELLGSVRTNRTAFDRVHGMTSFDYFERHVEAAEIFHEAMTNLTVPDSSAIVAAFDFSWTATVVDLGGGHGAFMATILRAYPHIRGILVDLPAAIDGAKRVMASEGLMDRCEFVTQDFFASVPGGGDLYTMKDILHDWDDDRAIALLRTCRRAMADDSRLLLVERVIPPGNVPHPGKLLDVTMLVITGGRERTEAEFRGLLEAAGFELTRILPTQSQFSIIEGAPV
jgi:hypothetical protein